MMKKYKFVLENNSFDLLKYWAAFSVMFLHYTYYAFVEAKQAWHFMDILRKISELFPGVIVLFAISGFLISDSMERSKSRKEFIKKRIFRLYPELWLCTIVNLFVLYVIAREYMDKSIFLWIATQILGIANTPPALDGFATGSINGALWTIFVEVQLYIIICFFYKGIKKIKINWWILILITLAGINLLCDWADGAYGGIISKLIERSFFPYALWFMIGVFCYRYKDKVIVYLRYMSVPMLVIYCFVYSELLRQPGYYKGIGISILCPVIIIGLAYLLPPLRIKPDLCYGIFLYHWIILNIIVHFQLLSRWKWYFCFIFFIVATLFLAGSSDFLMKRLLISINSENKRGDNL